MLVALAASAAGACRAQDDSPASRALDAARGSDEHGLFVAVQELDAAYDAAAILAAIRELPRNRWSGLYECYLRLFEIRALASTDPGAALEAIRQADQRLEHSGAEIESLSDDHRMAVGYLRSNLGFLRGSVLLHCGDPDLAAAELEGMPELQRATLRIGIALALEDFQDAVALCTALLESEALAGRPQIACQVKLQRIQARHRLRPTDDTLARLNDLLDEEGITDKERRLIHLERVAYHLQAGRLADAGDALDRVDHVDMPGPPSVREATLRALLALQRTAQPGGDASRPELARRDLLEVWSGLRARWQALPLREGGSQFLQYGERRDVLALALRLTRASNRDDAGDEALEIWLQAERQDSQVRAASIPTVDAATARALAPLDGGVLVYVPAPTGTALIAVTRQGARIFELPPDERILRGLLPLQNTVADPTIPLETVRRHATAAHALLLPNAVSEHIADWRSVWIVGSELLRAPTFEALTEGDGWFGTERTIAYLPTFSLGHRLRRAPPSETSRTGRIAVVAADRPDGSILEKHRLAPLRADEAQWRRPVQAFESSQVELLRGASANLVNARRVAADSTMTVFIAHGIFEPALPRPRGMALFDRGLFAGEIETFALPPLVTFLTCRAADMGRRGETVAPHIGGAAIQAGARAVLLSEQPLWLESALAMSEAFHDALLEDDAPHAAEALRRARARIAADRRFAHPAHHAGLQLVGWPELRPSLPPERRAADRRLIAWSFGLAASIALAASATWAHRRRRRPSRPVPAG